MVFKKLQSYKTENNLVIALTADAMTIDIQKAIDLGFHSYTAKPIYVFLIRW
jgi:CheY-like chemotaxis protein|tara:strand:+ start:148 stop:303 length:156 start_codon:yes stop_codon:yes gene_type:complete